MGYPMRYSVPDYLLVDAEKTVEAITSFIRGYVEGSRSSGVVLGLSGGTDSSVLAALTVRALGVDRVTALIMPERESSPTSISDAEEVARILKLKPLRIDITEGVNFVLRSFGDSYEASPRLAKANVKARLRMVMLYYLANKTNSLVLASSDRSEWLLGYFTKWGDGAADLYPLLNLYKTQIRLLGDYLGIPEHIVWKPSSPDLWPGHKASNELGADYDVIDPVLYLYVDRGMRVEEIARMIGVEQGLVSSIVSRISAYEHKRRFTAGPPPVRVLQP
ncbi:MAG: NAD+ synthase [Sulfolobales archaeon]